jgi:hypothetical protein
MSHSSEFCGDHVNLFRGFLAHISHPNKLPLYRIRLKSSRSIMLPEATSGSW